VKYQLGRLPLLQSPDAYIPQQRQRQQIESLPLDEDSVTNLARLPALHKDPFDRMLHLSGDPAWPDDCLYRRYALTSPT